MNDSNTNDPEFSGDSHLVPTYRPDWENSHPEWPQGQIHLEGELDFPADQPAREVADSLRDRAEHIGAIVSHNEQAGHIDAYPWNGPGFFRLSYDVDEPNASVDEISVFDRNNDLAAQISMDDLIENGEMVHSILDKVSFDRVDDDDETLYRITTDGLVPVDRDDVDL